MKGYKHRIIDSLLKKKFQAKGAVLIEGPKWCGDTDAALTGKTPMFIDEWQTVPKLWDTVKYTVNHCRKMEQFILTGSVVPNKEAEVERENTDLIFIPRPFHRITDRGRYN